MDEANSETPGLSLGAPAGAAPAGGGSYRVLARKYRPESFADLIGQEAMVRTVTNAFETGRIPQAWILTGVRGVGKTTTARIIARGLNYELPDGSVKGPTVNMPVEGVHCRAILESRHIDVLEMDAASHRGIEEVRQITDSVRYAPSAARYKVYIIDEVHMMTREGFNAFLKTLEEPPPHAKFIFATTDIQKVPVTVLSRCQRFDLRRVESGVIVAHLSRIAAAEGIEAEPEALMAIARASEGSVRDALSLFDQAIAHAAGAVRAADIRQMLGLADRMRVIDLFEHLMRGDMAAALAEFRSQYDTGADPAVILAELAEFTNFVTRIKVVPALAEDPAIGETERRRGLALAAALSMRVLARAWQMLLKGVTEVQAAPRPVSAGEMVLIRLAYAADLPTPDEALRQLENGGTAPARAPAAAPASMPRGPATSAAAAPRLAAQPAPAPSPSAAPAVRALNSFPELVALAAENRDLRTKASLEGDVRLVRFEDGLLEVALEPHASPALLHDLKRLISGWTGRSWNVVASSQPGAPSLRNQAAGRRDTLRKEAIDDPRVQAVMQRFPGASIVEIRPRGETPAPQAEDPPPMPGDELYSPDEMPDD